MTRPDEVCQERGRRTTEHEHRHSLWSVRQLVFSTVLVLVGSLIVYLQHTAVLTMPKYVVELLGLVTVIGFSYFVFVTVCMLMEWHSLRSMSKITEDQSDGFDAGQQLAPIEEPRASGEDQQGK